MDRTIYYRWRGDRYPDEYRSAEAAIADARDGDEVYCEVISGTRHTRQRVWPSPSPRDPESWDAMSR